MIPQEFNEPVTQALRETFGVSEFEDISRILRGQTPSLVYRIVVKGSPYLLKIITRAENPTRHYTTMKAAAEAGVAPRVLYTDIEHKISITDFVVAQPLSASEALVRLPSVLRTLHSLPPFARAPFNTTCTFLLHKGTDLTTGPALESYLQKFREANLLPPAECEEFFARYAEIDAIYPYGDGEMVASHNDLFKPDNILFDGQRLWLVDWEAAFLNDRYADLAVAANHVVTNYGDERTYLREYFRAEPTAYQQARFHLMQQVAHLFYTLGFLLLGSMGQPVDWSRPVPSFRDFHRRMWAGEIDLTDRDVKIAYGRIHWERLQSEVRQARYQEALRIVSDRQPRDKVRQPDTGH